MRRIIHVLGVLEGFTRNLFPLKMNLEMGLNEISNDRRRFESRKGFSIRYGNYSNTGKIFHEIGNDSRRKGFSMDSFVSGTRLILRGG